MTDTPDYLGFEDPAEKRAALGPAFIAPAKMGPRELVTFQRMKLSAHRAATSVMFTMTDEETGAEVWDQSTDGPKRFHGGDAWQKLMNWPRTPTIEEARAFQLNAALAAQAAWWSRLQEARALDEKYGWTNEDEIGSAPTRPPSPPVSYSDPAATSGASTRGPSGPPPNGPTRRTLSG